MQQLPGQHQRLAGARTGGRAARGALRSGGGQVAARPTSSGLARRASPEPCGACSRPTTLPPSRQSCERNGRSAASSGPVPAAAPAPSTVSLPQGLGLRRCVGPPCPVSGQGNCWQSGRPAAPHARPGGKSRRLLERPDGCVGGWNMLPAARRAGLVSAARPNPVAVVALAVPLCQIDAFAFVSANHLAAGRAPAAQRGEQGGPPRSLLGP